MKLIVGLGNPGEKYAGNRHNIGFMAVDEIARGYSFGPWKKRFQGITAEGQIGTEKCILLKPATYMNESGRAAGDAMRFYKLTPTDVIVIHDELDLKAGVVRVKSGGGNAGHNGLKSLSAHIGNDYKRVRLGIGHPGDKALVIHYVLQDFVKADKEWLVPFLDGIARGMDRLVEGSDAAFLSEAARGRVAAKLNGATAPAAVAAKTSKPAPKIEAAPKAEKSLEAAIAAAVATSTPGKRDPGGNSRRNLQRRCGKGGHAARAGARSREACRGCQGARRRSSTSGSGRERGSRSSCRTCGAGEGGPCRGGRQAARRGGCANVPRTEEKGRIVQLAVR